MYLDPNGDFGIIATIFIGGMIGAAISGGINIFQQIRGGNEFDVPSLLINMVGGFFAGAISAIPIPGFRFLSNFLSGLTGEAGSVIGGIIAGSVTDFKSAAIAFGIGAIAGVISKGVAHIRLNVQSKSILSIHGKARSLAINDFMIKHNFTPVNMGHSTFGGWSRNIFKSICGESVTMLVEEAFSRSAIVYSAIVSSSLSGWYENGY